MNRIFDKETGKSTWELDRWFDKALWIGGWLVVAYMGLMALAFIVGFAIGVAGTL